LVKNGAAKKFRSRLFLNWLGFTSEHGLIAKTLAQYDNPIYRHSLSWVNLDIVIDLDKFNFDFFVSAFKIIRLLEGGSLDKIRLRHLH
jgi:hypothetical protein